MNLCKTQKYDVLCPNLCYTWKYVLVKIGVTYENVVRPNK